MSVEIVNGNVVSALLNGEITTLLHVTNCQGVMGSGIAKQIKDRVPTAYKAYMKHKPTLGGHSWASVDGAIVNICGVYNLNAQEFYGYDKKRYLNYGALATCLEAVADFEDTDSVIGIPYKMGSDRAGGDWEIVKELIEFILDGFEIRYYKL